MLPPTKNKQILSTINNKVTNTYEECRIVPDFERRIHIS